MTAPSHRIGLKPSLTSEMAAAVVLRDCRAFITEQIEKVVAGDDVEGPHQLRVGLRRLRSVLAFFRPVIGGHLATAIGMAARNLGQIVGRTRDLDVFVIETLPKLSPYLSGSAHAAVLAHFEALRLGERERLQVVMAGEELQRCLNTFDGFVERRRWLNARNYAQTERLAQPFGDFARKRLNTQWKRLAKRAHRLSSQHAKDRHQFRKDLKKLRYAVDLCAPIIDQDALKPFLKRLKELQDVVGVLNDVAVARQLVDEARERQALKEAQLSELKRAITQLERSIAEDQIASEELWRRVVSRKTPWRNLGRH